MAIAAMRESERSDERVPMSVRIEETIAPVIASLPHRNEVQCTDCVMLITHRLR